MTAEELVNALNKSFKKERTDTYGQTSSFSVWDIDKRFKVGVYFYYHEKRIKYKITYYEKHISSLDEKLLKNIFTDLSADAQTFFLFNLDVFK